MNKQLNPSSRKGFVRLPVFGIIVLIVVCLTGAGRLRALAGPPAPNSAQWYCHSGALLLHAGMKYREKSGPMDWDLSALSKSGDDYNECYNRAQKDGDPVTELDAIRGYAAAKIMIAETANSFSLLARLVAGAKARNDFDNAHKLALLSARQALEAFDPVDGLMSQLDGSDDAEAYLNLTNLMQNAKQLTASVKQTIMNTSFDNAPRSKTELAVWISTGRVPEYSINSEWGLTKEERCPTKSTPITVEGDVKQKAPGLTGISIEVADDGTLKSAHIIQSSGNTEADEAALTDAYNFKYHAATKRCDSIASSTVIWL